MSVATMLQEKEQRLAKPPHITPSDFFKKLCKKMCIHTPVANINDSENAIDAAIASENGEMLQHI
jgi:hypothetical protein